jgi:hypothetical protein
MRGRLTRILFPAAAVAVTVTLSPAGALATTWSISPARKFTASLHNGTSLNKGTTIFFNEPATGYAFACLVASAKGDVPKAGHGLPGNGIATISSNTWGTTTQKCVAVAGVGACTAVSTNTPWKFTPVSYDPSVDGGQTTGMIATSGTGIGFRLTCIDQGGACSMTVGGTKSAPARANFLYDNKSHLLAITSVKSMHLTKTNCQTSNPGDRVWVNTYPLSKSGKAVTHGYSVSPAIKLTSP